MKKNEKTKLREQSVPALLKEVVGLETELVSKLSEHKLGKLKNTHTTSIIKRKIAIIKTIIGEKQLQTAS